MLGVIKKMTEKALLIEFKNGEIWIPRSAVHSPFININELKQDFLINNWILHRNHINQ